MPLRVFGQALQNPIVVLLKPIRFFEFLHFAGASGSDGFEVSSVTYVQIKLSVSICAYGCLLRIEWSKFNLNEVAAIIKQDGDCKVGNCLLGR